ncbi:hypothetical protein IAR55_001494 [Kwoniella newhampshirensis]|uniref:Chromo domain-containing protein n=1 Tax=Kwoniella newhampshirensis TaxID=1651941 RepID=A0AAW0Z2B8_9TREE
MPPRSSSSSLSPEPVPETQFISLADDAENLWEVEEILDERGPARTGEYLVLWKGIDPETGEQWEPSWTIKNGCTQGLIDEWKMKKKHNPGIVGVAAKEFQEIQDAKNARKRKRLPMPDSKGKGKKRKVAGESTTRGRTARSKDTSSTVSKSPERPTLSKAEGAGHNALRRSQRAASAVSSTGPARRTRTQDRLHDRRDSASASVEPAAAPSRTPSPKPANARPKRATHAKGSVQSSPAQATAGPGPSTIAQRDQQNSSSDHRALDTLAMPPPRSSPKGHGHDVIQSQTSRSGADSQTDPIDQFSSPLSRQQNKQAKGTGFIPPRPVNVGPARDGVDADRAERASIKDENEVEQGKIKVVRKVINGDEVYERVTDSDEEDATGQEAVPTSASVAAQAERSHRDGYVTAPFPNQDLNDADLDGLSTGDAEEGHFPEAVHQDGHYCRWEGCPASFESLEDLASHFRAHASEYYPDQESAILNPVAPYKAPNPPPETTAPLPHPDTEQLAKVKAEMANLLDELALVKAAAISTSPEIERLKARVDQLEVEVEQANSSRKSVLDDNIFLRQQYDTASTRAVEEVNIARKLREKVATLEEQLDFGLKQRKLLDDEVNKRREKEFARLKGQVKILLDQSRRTDDTVRRKAAFYDRYKAEYDGLVSTLSEQSTKIETLELRNEELVDQFAALRAAQMGVLGEEGEGDSDNDNDNESHREGSNDRSTSPLGNMIMDEIPSSLKRYGDHSTSTPSRPQRVPSHALSNASANGDDGEQAVRQGGQGYLCKWGQGGDQGCLVVCDTVEELHEHALDHQRAELVREL